MSFIQPIFVNHHKFFQIVHPKSTFYQIGKGYLQHWIFFHTQFDVTPKNGLCRLQSPHWITKWSIALLINFSKFTTLPSFHIVIIATISNLHCFSFCVDFLQPFVCNHFQVPYPSLWAFLLCLYKGVSMVWWGHKVITIWLFSLQHIFYVFYK